MEGNGSSFFEIESVEIEAIQSAVSCASSKGSLAIGFFLAAAGETDAPRHPPSTSTSSAVFLVRKK